MPTPKRTKPTGPEPERLKIEGEWDKALTHALKRGKPPAPKKKPVRKQSRRK